MSVGPGLGVLALVVTSIGLPINTLWSYLVVLVAAVFVFTGSVTLQASRWLVAIVIVAAAIFGQMLVSAPRIDEGHNIFVVDKPGGALEQQLPAAVFRAMLEEFDARYPTDKRCPRDDGVCWRGQIFPDRPYAFSADGIYQKPEFSRRVSGIDFTDAVWLRIGATNEMYNWYEGRSDIQRRERHPLDLAHPWRLLMPWYVMYRFPADFVGSTLCWRGKVLWEGANEDFSVLTHSERTCRTLGADDVGKRVFGVAISNDPPLEMTLVPTAGIRIRQLAEQCLAIAGALAAFFLLTAIRWRRAILPFGLLALAAAGIVLQDSTFFAGFAPQGAGGDGIYYEAVGRRFTESLLCGRYAEALSGGVAVFYANPGMSYLRGIERFFVGDTNLGYTTLLLILPLLTYAIWRRFLPRTWALAAALILGICPLVTAVFAFNRADTMAFGFIAIIAVLLAWRRMLSFKWAAAIVASYAVIRLLNPYGEQVSLQLTQFAYAIARFLILVADQYSLEFGRWTANAMEGFGDAAAFIFFLLGYILLARSPMNASPARFAPAFSAAFLMVLSVSIRPPLAVTVSIMLGGAGLACLYWRQYARLAGLCLGFAPILLIPLHNWYFGGVLVLLSTNAAAVTVMTPSDLVAAFGELVRLDVFGPHLELLVTQILIFLSARSAYGLTKAIGVLVMLLVMCRRQYDSWLRLTALAMLAQGFASLFFVLDRRYLILDWYLTALVVAVWLNQPDTQANIARVWNCLSRRMPWLARKQNA